MKKCEYLGVSYRLPEKNNLPGLYFIKLLGAFLGTLNCQVNGVRRLRKSLKVLGSLGKPDYMKTEYRNIKFPTDCMKYLD